MERLKNSEYRFAGFSHYVRLLIVQDLKANGGKPSDDIADDVTPEQKEFEAATNHGPGS